MLLGAEAVFFLAGVEWSGERGGVSCGVGLFGRLADPGVGQELLDRVAFVRVDGEEVRHEILGRFGDVVPPRGQECVLAAGDFLGEDLNAFVVEGGEAAEQGVEDAA